MTNILGYYWEIVIGNGTFALVKKRLTFFTFIIVDALLREAIKDGSAEAKTLFALLSLEGRFGEPNLAEAELFLKQAAEQGEPTAKVEYERIQTEKQNKCSQTKRLKADEF